MNDADPLGGPEPDEVPLANAPLVGVIAQVRFPIIATVEQREFIAPFQEAIRSRYPVLRPERILQVTTPGAAEPVREGVAWRFRDIAHHWTVSLTSEFVALETTAYTSRADFLTRFDEVLAALEAHVRPALVDRLGVRYTDRIVGEPLARIDSLVRPQMLGVLALPIGARATHAISQCQFEVDDARLLVRWGRVPANATIDPGIEPIAEASWVLDLDMSFTPGSTFARAEIMERARAFAARVYTFFRWAVTPDFLSTYRGDQ